MYKTSLNARVDMRDLQIYPYFWLNLVKYIHKFAKSKDNL